MPSSTHTSHEALAGGHWAITCASSDTNWLNLFLSAKRLDAVLTVMGYTVCSAGKHKRLSELRSVSGPDQTHEPGKRKTTQKQRSSSSKRCGRRPSSDAYCYVNCFAKARRTLKYTSTAAEESSSCFATLSLGAVLLPATQCQKPQNK